MICRAIPRLSLAILLLVMSTAATVAGPVLSGRQGKPGVPFSADRPPLRSVAPGVFELGNVRLDKRRKAVSFPAVVNMTNGIIEYLVVTTQGKTHESLLKTEAEPYHIHVGMLLLGIKGSKSFPVEPSDDIPGDKVNIELSWTEQGKTNKCSAESWVVDSSKGTHAADGPWAYNGSRMRDGVFMVQQEGSIVSMISDADALINNPRPGRERDDNWRVRGEGVPSLGSVVEVTIYMR